MINFLHHLFLPKETNNYRSGLLHHKTLLAITLLFISAGLFASFVKSNFPAVLGISANFSNQELLILTNQQRQNNNLAPLTDNSELDQAAANKAADMFSKDYWAHNAPDGTTPWVFIKSAGYNYIYAGENLARGFNSASDVISAWMNSPEHRQNVLSPNYQNVGFAVATGRLSGEDTVLVVEMLGSTTLAPIANGAKTSVAVAIASGSPTVKTTTTNIPSAPSIKPAANLVSNTQLLGANSLSIIKPLINSQNFSLTLAGIILLTFIFVLFLDAMVVERRKIVRFVGHNLDHILFFSLMILIILILAKGSII
jgi:uncharacterized protein YkwD